MLPSMKFYIISIVSIFVALGIGIFIGFTMNTQEFIVDQQDIITEVVETQMNNLIDENKDLKLNIGILQQQNEIKEEYIDLSYESILKDKLIGIKVGIISTNEDYITSSIGRDLELAGATVMNMTTLNDTITDKDALLSLYSKINMESSPMIVEDTIKNISNAIIKGEFSTFLDDLETDDFLETIGNYEEALDYIIICGGSINDNQKRIVQVDKTIVQAAMENGIQIRGVEKSTVNYSYISAYQDLGISTVDNVDTIMGKVALVLSMTGLEGNFGIKQTASKLIPSIYK